MPVVRMGIEVREQIWGQNGLEDATVTRQDHPLVRYAEIFTHYFDLIAERRSVLYHLRELAKAAVLAKFLLDDEFSLDDALFKYEAETERAWLLEIPQLWNERYFGELKDASTGVEMGMYGVYGGVEFGLDRAPPLRAMRFTQSARTLAIIGARDMVGEASLLRPFPLDGRPQGVDLSLDAFDSSSLKEIKTRPCTASWGRETFQSLAGTFWSSVDCEGDARPLVSLAEEDNHFLRAIFNPYLSDRRDEGDLFTPPDPSCDYVCKLRDLLKEEEALRQQRREFFVSEKFQKDDAGPLFPSSWRMPSFSVAHSAVATSSCSAKGGRTPDAAEAPMLRRIIGSATPLFDKSTEDGMRFRIYQVGDLEVRTTQEFDGTEVINVVFSNHTDPESVEVD